MTFREFAAKIAELAAREDITQDAPMMFVDNQGSPLYDELEIRVESDDLRNLEEGHYPIGKWSFVSIAPEFDDNECEDISKLSAKAKQELDDLPNLAVDLEIGWDGADDQTRLARIAKRNPNWMISVAPIEETDYAGLTKKQRQEG